MKLTKMSLVAALLIGSSAFAIENTAVSGNAQMFYNTTDGGGDLFDQSQSAADFGFNLNLTSDLVKTDSVAVSAGAGATVLATLGLENNLVSGVWGNAHTLTGSKVDNAMWMNEAWLAATAGKTTFKLGRMELDTPLAFTEAWTIEKNTFEGLVLINEDIPSTTLVGAYIGNGNGTEGFGATVPSASIAMGGVVNADGEFTTYGTDGAYAIGAINNSFEPLTLQAWYYNITDLTDAYWLQADLNIEGIMAGAQYSGHTLDAAGSKEDNVYALMLGYEMTDMFTAKIAYSEVNKDGSLGYAGFNTATDITYAQSKLYTEAWWNYGQITIQGAKSMNLTLETPAAGYADLGLYITDIDHVAANSDLLEVTATVSKSFGPLDTSLAYIYTDVDGSDSVNILQAYLTLNF